MQDQPAPANNQAPNDHSVFDEVKWALKRAMILFRYWVMPPNAPIVEASKDDRTSAAALALVVIVALTFAIRGEGSSDATSFTLLASGIATVLSIILNAASKQFRVEIRHQVLISAYTSTILVMVSFIIIRLTLRGTPWFQWLQMQIGNEWGPIIAPAIFSVPLIYVCFVLKAKFIDHGRLTPSGAAHGLLVTICSGVITVVIALLSDDVFRKIMSFFRTN